MAPTDSWRMLDLFFQKESQEIERKIVPRKFWILHCMTGELQTTGYLKTKLEK